MLFVADQDNTSVSSRVRVSAYDISETQLIEKAHSYKTTRGDPAPALPSVEITIYPQLEDLPDSIYSSAHTNAVYETYEVDTEYHEDSFIFMVPKAGTVLGVPLPNGGPNPQPIPIAGSFGASSPLDTSAFVRACSPQAKRVIRISAQRHGKPPRMPNPASFVDQEGITHVRTRQAILGMEPTLAPDGQAHTYKVNAEFHYGMSRPATQFRFVAGDYEAVESLGAGTSQFSFALSALFSSPQPIG